MTTVYCKITQCEHYKSIKNSTLGKCTGKSIIVARHDSECSAVSGNPSHCLYCTYVYLYDEEEE